ncbi:DUF5625 family protein [Pseudomonas sp. TE3610]
MKGLPFTLCLLCLAPCTRLADASEAAPLSLKSSGAVTGLAVRIVQEDSYSVRIDYFYPATDPLARKVLWDAAGGGRDSGAPFSVNLRIYDVDDAVVIQDRRISHPALSSWSAGVLHAELSEVHLERGRYQITVERRGSAGAIADYRAGVSVVRAW